MNKLLKMLSAIRNILTPETEDQLEECLLDAIQSFVKKTDNKVDDMIATPILHGIRLMLNVPERKEEKKLEVVK